MLQDLHGTGHCLAAAAGLPGGMPCLPPMGSEAGGKVGCEVGSKASSKQPCSALPRSPRNLGRATKLGSRQHRARVGWIWDRRWVRVGGLGLAGLRCPAFTARATHPSAHQLLQQEAPSCMRPRNPHFFLFFFSPVAGVRWRAAPGSPGWLHVSRITTDSPARLSLRQTGSPGMIYR